MPISNLNTTQPTVAGDSNLPKQIEPLTSYNSKGTRFTCVTVADGDMDNLSRENGKQEPKEDEDMESEDWDSDESAWGGVSETC